MSALESGAEICASPAPLALPWIPSQAAQQAIPAIAFGRHDASRIYTPVWSSGDQPIATTAFSGTRRFFVWPRAGWAVFDLAARLLAWPDDFVGIHSISRRLPSCCVLAFELTSGCDGLTHR